VVLEAFRRLDRPGCRLTVVGDGPVLGELRKEFSDVASLELVGAVPSDRIRDLYANADVFAFPSQHDPFGLVLVEAFAAGLATVTSSYPGAVDDLAVHDHNAIVLDDNDPAIWAQALGRLVEDRALRERLGSAAQATIAARWTIGHSVDAWMAGLRLGALVT
jgi:glycosyltransferase involved in cell wall biosynthesis